MPVARAAKSSHEESITAVVGDGWSSAQVIELKTKRKPSPCGYPMMVDTSAAPRQSKAVSIEKYYSLLSRLLIGRSSNSLCVLFVCIMNLILCLPYTKDNKYK